ncbi:MAG: glycogen/starch synthase [Kiritimatiellia bacterium]|nr:glycogen/starch synthase [Kiritimatiellia bacterium]
MKTAKPPRLNPPPAKGNNIIPQNTLLFEIAWEVCQQLGGIYTVIRSKAPRMIENWGDRYFMIGPYNPVTAAIEFEESSPTDLVADAFAELKDRGFDIHYGHWLISGRPQVILLNTHSAMRNLDEIKYYLWHHHRIGTPTDDDELNQVVSFGFLVQEFFRVLTKNNADLPPIIAHFHEWMAGAAIPEMRRLKLPPGIVFTTHATLLGRYIAMADTAFYDHLPFIKWENDARRFNIESRVRLERAAAHGAHVFTTVSNVTALECKYLIQREVDQVLPNGLNVERFTARHESENLHMIHKERINKFIIGHFFPSYSFNLDRTLYFFTSGRYEYRNKGFDLTLEALARLNARLKQNRSDLTIVMFIISRRPFRSIIAETLNNKAMTEELYNTCMMVKNQIGARLFKASATGQLPDFNALVDESYMMRLKRILQAWRTNRLPSIVTHDLLDQDRDEVLNQLRQFNMVNHPDDPVKIIYHPDFMTLANPLFSLEYDQFVRGCHLGLFPSYYEPWGYTPLECLARNIPAVASDLSGFGSYILNRSPDCQQKGLYVVKRKNTSYDIAAEELTNYLLAFCKLDTRERIALRFHTQELAEQFDWKQLIGYYNRAHTMAARMIGDDRR